jgi:predicted anti-sigma-YlaC factor YlaD
MMSCRDVTARASAYLDGDLGRWERLRLQAHLAICAGCRRYLRQLATTLAVLRRLPSTAPVGEVVDRLSVLFSAAMGEKPRAIDDAPV